MCGILAFAGEWEPAIVEGLIGDIRRRGPDMLGLAFVGCEVSRFRVPSWPGTIQLSHLVEKRAVDHPAAGIAHARLITSGNALADAQPLSLDPETLFAHNGIVYDHQRFASHYGIQLRTGNDSEALGRLLQLLNFDGHDACRRLEAHQGRGAHAWIAATPQRIWIASWGQPLFIRETARARYVSSWRFPLSERVGDRVTLRWVLPRAGVNGNAKVG